MAFPDFPLDAFLKAQLAKNQNQQQMNQDIAGIGQSIGQTGQMLGQQMQEAKKKQILDQLVQAMKSQGQPIQGPQGYVPPGAGSNAVPAGQAPDMSGQIQGLMTQLNPELGAKMYMQGQKNRPGLGKRTVYELDDGSISLNPVEGSTPLVVSDAQALQYSAKTPSRSSGENLGKVTWDSASPDEQGLAKAVYEGNVRPGDLGFRERSRVVQLANIYGSQQGRDPFQSFSGDVKKGAAQSFATGKLGQNALALNTAMGHLNSAFDAYKAMGNTDQAFLNTPLNVLKKRTNDPNIVKLSAALNAVRGEAATVFKGSGATDQEISSWQNSISENATPAQAMGALSEMNELFGSRLSALDYQKKDTSNRPSQRTLLSPHATTLSKRFGAMGKDKPKAFLNVQQAEAANLPPGTKVMIGGRSATIQ